MKEWVGEIHQCMRDVIYERTLIWNCSDLLKMRSREGLAPRDRGTWTLTIRRTADWMWTIEAAEADSRPARGYLTRLANVVAIVAVTNATTTVMLMMKSLKDRKIGFRWKLIQNNIIFLSLQMKLQAVTGLSFTWIVKANLTCFFSLTDKKQNS